MPWSPNPVQGGVKMWVYSQDTASTTWNIYHGMGVEPIVEIQVPNDDNVLVKAYPAAIIQVDVNTVEIQWTVPRSGKVTFLAPY